MTQKIQITTIFQRRDEINEFHRIPKELLSYVEDKYIATGKIISRDSYQSSDKLSKTLITHYSSEESKMEYMNDPVIVELLKARNQHCRSNYIRITILTQAYDDTGIISSATQVINPTTN